VLAELRGSKGRAEVPACADRGVYRGEVKSDVCVDEMEMEILGCIGETCLIEYSTVGLGI